MVSAYAIRKLVEAHKITDALRAKRLKVTKYPLIDRPPDLFNYYSFWEYYDLERGDPTDLSLLDLCNQIIHSWVWLISATEDNLFNGLFVSSDRRRRQCLYLVDIDVLIDLFRKVGNNHVTEMKMARDRNGEMQVIYLRDAEISGS